MADICIARPQLTSAAADAILAAVRSAAAERQLTVSAAIVDDSAMPKAFHRMDGTTAISVELATNKARTAARTGRSTHEWFELLSADENLRLAATTSIGDLVLFGGGVAIRDKAGHLLGGLGVSGASQEEDQVLAAAGLAALDRDTPDDQGGVDAGDQILNGRSGA